MKLTIIITIRVPQRFTDNILQTLLDEIRDMIYRMLPDLQPIPNIPTVQIETENV